MIYICMIYICMIYIYIYIYIYKYISCILTTCYMWCANEIYYSQVKLSKVLKHLVTGSRRCH